MVLIRIRIEELILLLECHLIFAICELKSHKKLIANFNGKSDQEQVFHTRDKNGLIIHPTSYFASQPKSLEPTGKTEPDPLQPNKERLVSHRHQLLAYHSLLETSKPYVMMPVRVPALHTSLLFSSEIDTSGSCQTIVTDRWIEYRLHQVNYIKTYMNTEKKYFSLCDFFLRFWSLNFPKQNYSSR